MSGHGKADGMTDAEYRARVHGRVCGCWRELDTVVRRVTVTRRMPARRVS